MHVRAADGTPLANVMLSVLHKLGRRRRRQFGDSTARFDLNGDRGGDDVANDVG